MFSAPVSGESNFITFNIKCEKCGEIITINLRTTSDLSRIYDEDSAPANSTFFVRKEILGENCNNLIYLTAYFTYNYELVSCDVTGGKIIEK
jgi:hypothetical protein